MSTSKQSISLMPPFAVLAGSGFVGLLAGTLIAMKTGDWVVLAGTLTAALASAVIAGKYNQTRIQKVLEQLKSSMRGESATSKTLAICAEWGELIEELMASRELKKSLSKHSSEIAIAAAEMSFAADQLREGIHNEVADTSKIVESANHIHQSVEIMVEQTQEAARFAKEAMETNHRGKQAIDETIPQMEGTREKVNANAELISQLETKSEEIQSVTRVISDIAEQTNLLALNAAIEAARAGEQGRGFAVVADEVRALAAKTSSATQQIGNTVDQINSAIKHAVGNSQELTRVIDQGVNMTQNIQQQLLVIHSQSQEIQNTINTIADSVAANSDHIGHISDIVKVTSERLESTEGEVSSISGRSLSLAETAEKIYESFRPGELGGIHDAALSEAQMAAEAIAMELEQLMNSGQLGESDVFDVNYQPVPNTNPKKYNTRYDSFSDKHFPAIQEPILERNPQFAYAGAVDVNGYFPTHNKRFSQPVTGDYEKDLAQSRTKRIFNDRTGLRCGQNTQPFLLQTYKRDTGEVMHDVSAPIIVRGRHWGGFRIGYRSV